jgi:hypothetical protein
MTKESIYNKSLDEEELSITEMAAGLKRNASTSNVDNLKKILEKEGIKVYLTPTYEKSDPNNTTKDLADRYDFINKIKPDLSISIHHDYAISLTTRGFTVYKWRDNKGQSTVLKRNITKELRKTSKECQLNHNGYSECYPGHQNFAMVREPKCDALLIECGFFSNLDDVKLTEKYSWTIAYRIACGILNKQIIDRKKLILSTLSTLLNDPVESGINIAYIKKYITDKSYWLTKCSKDKDVEQMFKNISKKGE